MTVLVGDDEWDPKSDIEDNERKLVERLRERLAPFVEPEELDDAIGAAFPVIADFAGQYSSIQGRRHMHERRAKRDGETKRYPTD